MVNRVTTRSSTRNKPVRDKSRRSLEKSQIGRNPEHEPESSDESITSEKTTQAGPEETTIRFEKGVEHSSPFPDINSEVRKDLNRENLRTSRKVRFNETPIIIQ